MNQSALTKAFANKKVIVKKIISGEIVIKFIDARVNPIYLSNDNDVDLTKIEGVDIENLKRSNLAGLIATRKLSLIFLS